MRLNIGQFDLDFDNIGYWPRKQRLAVIGVAAVVVLIIGLLLDTRTQISSLDTLQTKEKQLLTQFIDQNNKSANLSAYEKQMLTMEKSFALMLDQLPAKAEVDNLLEDISQIGSAEGLQFDLFNPEGEQLREFYAELPVQLKLRGHYHQFGHFSSALARMPRIATLQDFTIASEKDSPLLTMDATAKTYRYLDEAEIARINEQKQQQRDKRG